MLIFERAGALSTVQDAGRRGYRGMGVAACGAMDGLAYEIASLLVGNRAGEAAIEIAICPVRIRFECDAMIALAGARVDASVDGVALPSGWRTAVNAGQRLQINAVHWGVRVVLAVSGGIDVAPVLGSRSTDLRSGFGGLQGRRLRDGDRLRLGPAPQGPASRARFGVTLPAWEPTLRVIPGPELAAYEPAARAELWRTAWSVAPESDRMGLRLTGSALSGPPAQAMNSYAVVPGLIQCPPSGRPILLACDAQTTGGYPRVGVAIRADLWKLAQWRPGTTMRLTPETPEGAARAWREQRLFVERIESGLDARGP